MNGCGHVFPYWSVIPPSHCPLCGACLTAQWWWPPIAPPWYPTVTTTTTTTGTIPNAVQTTRVTLEEA